MGQPPIPHTLAMRKERPNLRFYIPSQQS